MGIDIDELYVSSSGGIETRIEPPSYDVGESQESTYEALLGDGDATIVELAECKDTVILAATCVS